ncbi:MAG: hypothetical protein AB7U82_01705 [Blastocatellales bacterium]
MKQVFSRLNDKFDLGALIALALMLCALSVSRLIYPFDLGHFEACVWTPSLMSAQGHNPYGFALREPFVMAPYGYFYYLIVGLGVRLFGWQLWFGRALTVVSAVVCVVWIAKIAWALTRDRRAAMLAVIFFLSTNVLFHWVGVHRPDLLAMAFSFAALALVFTSRDEPDRIGWRVLMVIALLVSAFFFKQTALLPIAVAIARYLQLGKMRLAMTILAGVALICSIIALALNATSDGGYFWQHLTLMKQTPQNYDWALKWFIAIFKSPSTWIGLAVVYGAIVSRFGWAPFRIASLTRERLISLLQSPGALLLAYFVVAFTFAFVTSSRVGAYINYYLEALIVLAIIVALSWKQLSAGRLGGKSRYLYTAAVCLFALGAEIEFWRLYHAESFRYRSEAYYREIVETLAREVPPQSTIISVHPELATASGHNYHFGDFLQYGDGRSEQLREVIQREISSGRYRAVVWVQADSPMMKGYRLVPMKQSAHEKYYPVYLYLRDDSQTSRGQSPPDR